MAAISPKPEFDKMGRYSEEGPSWVCGVVVMSIKDDHIGFPGLSQLDPISACQAPWPSPYLDAFGEEPPSCLEAIGERFRFNILRYYELSKVCFEFCVANDKGKFTVPSISVG
ncbi:hypothetical protein ACSQ67_009733 [Phaseolus vulgaris]